MTWCHKVMDNKCDRCGKDDSIVRRYSVDLDEIPGSVVSYECDNCVIKDINSQAIPILVLVYIIIVVGLWITHL